ncbi:Sec-independent protein translocase protein TatB [Arcobacter sp. FWKO B]|uniref:Sec-independent protein translocase protein TatB n=1 Tax=Arcobacter sp. FWKO B TaxID=2593672 RepID=UPI0018A65525|nr:Sec-independent protein translocase protein TatB [Arcobacter sp. FWKO B]QOG11359.1 Sec-independent protein translocase subunit TatB [Arcobacter sp. FWKO B]
MFGMGFLEITIIAIVAIIALGPEKLPSAMVDIAKFFKKLKSGIDDAKSTLNNELKITELKAEAEKYKSQVENLQSSINIENILNDEPAQKEQQTQNTENKQEAVQQTQETKEPLRQKVSFGNKNKVQNSESI